MPITLPDLSALLKNSPELFQGLNLWGILECLGYIALGIILTLYFRRLIGNWLEKHVSAHHSQLLRRIIFYIGVILSTIIPLKYSGIDVNGLLNIAGVAAAILTTAVAFASQTTISNFLSGVFLLAEKPFEVGDYVTINDTLGEVLSIDLLSVKIRTKDNILVRIPNEQLLKSQFKNTTRFPIRRCDVKLRVSFTEDLQKLKKILMEVAKQNSLCLVSPPPDLSFIEFGESTILLQFSVWAKQPAFSSLQTNIQMEIQAALYTHDIKLPSPSALTLTTS